MLKNKYFWLVFLAALLASGYLLVPRGESQDPAYRSGEVVSFQGQVVIATVDTGALEFFRIVDNAIRKTGLIRSDESGYSEFVDVALKEQAGRQVVCVRYQPQVYLSV